MKMKILRPFQSSDVSRLALTDGGILGWQPGLGKTRAAYALAFLKCGFQHDASTNTIQPKAPVLFVVPGDLHPQYIEEGQNAFCTTVTPLDSKAAFLACADFKNGSYILRPGFYITSYYELGTNGIAKFPEINPEDHAAALAALHLQPSHVADNYERLWQNFARASYSGRCELHHLGLRSSEAPDAGVAAPRTLTALPEADRLLFTTLFLRGYIHECRSQIGEIRILSPSAPSSELSVPGAGHPVRCVYDPSLADLARHAFTCVIVDEGTKMKSDYSQIALGVRTLHPRYRYVCTATPVKNRVPDLFHLLSWALNNSYGPATTRFPFAWDDKDSFAQTFCVSEQAIALDGKPASRSRIKLTPQVCNIHRLWKTTAPGLLRRRKQDIAESLPARHKHLIRVPMGSLQRLAYKAHLDHYNPTDRHGRRATGAVLTGLRQCAIFPASAPLAGVQIPADAQDPAHLALLEPVERGSRRASRACPPGTTITVPGPNDTPAMHTILQLILKFLRAGEQFILFAPFTDPLDGLSQRLAKVGISHLILDGRSSPRQRAKLAAQFKHGPARGGIIGALAGIESMAEGHNFPLAKNAILWSYPWALDKVQQAIDRIHRLNTPFDVNIYHILTQGTIDRRLESQIDEKADSAELILDGHLLGENKEEVNLRELLNIAYEEFNAAGAAENTIPESILAAQWPDLGLQLEQAARSWPVAPPPVAAPAIPALRIPDPSRSPNWKDRYLARLKALVPA